MRLNNHDVSTDNVDKREKSVSRSADQNDDDEDGDVCVFIQSALVHSVQAKLWK